MSSFVILFLNFHVGDFEGNVTVCEQGSERFFYKGREKGVVTEEQRNEEEKRK